MHFAMVSLVTYIGVRQGIFLGMQKMFAQILILFYTQTTYKHQIVMLRLKRAIENKSRWLHA